jgi:uncharacterized Ntn-hydrolase superfamily protein
MTYSVLGLDRASSTIGCAAATGNLAVGGWVLRASARVGAVATQGYAVSPLWGDGALALLASGKCADEALAALTEPDAGRDFRQMTILDAKGGAAAWTGTDNPDVKGHIVGTDMVVAGNWLANDSVLGALQAGYEAGDQDMDFGRRLLASLEAGRAAGGDHRGTMSAAIRIVRPDRPPIDLRVDLDEAPLERLRALYEMAIQPPYSDWAKSVPTLDDPYRC